MKNYRFFILIVFLLCFIFIFLGCNSETHDKQNPPKSNTKANIEIIDWTNRLSDPPIYYYVEGILKNTSNKTADYVEVTTKALDENDKLVSIDYGYSNPDTMLPNQEATFQIMVENKPEIKKFAITVNWK